MGFMRMLLADVTAGISGLKKAGETPLPLTYTPHSGCTPIFRTPATPSVGWVIAIDGAICVALLRTLANDAGVAKLASFARPVIERIPLIAPGKNPATVSAPSRMAPNVDLRLGLPRALLCTRLDF